ncbi:MAG: tRNA (adenosine(37)-N6)-dimethylallyltransferase MiaA [Chlorobiaceae bacterium]|nr:tRNA (adenosine(37)-N6)-dimethylallyltransferase MiaA [Chlorobiaceae bacterium]
MTRKPVLVILGPTASGKSELAFRVARMSGAEIVSADSRQIYRGMDIGTAKPPRHMLESVPHHFIDEKEIGQPFSAGDFAVQAVDRIREIQQRGVPAIVAGGSTLYLEGVLKGFSALPPSDPEIRARLIRELEKHGARALYRRLETLDPQQALTLDASKTQRIIRSLEIIEISGTTVTALQQSRVEAPGDLEFIVSGIDMPRPLLYDRINRRSAEMIESGLVEEARHLHEKFRLELTEGKVNALATVGYQELFDCFEEKIDLETAITLISQHTRNYAKRQLTFFKNRLNVEWLDSPLNESGIAELAEKLCYRIS